MWKQLSLHFVAEAMDKFAANLKKLARRKIVKPSVQKVFKEAQSVPLIALTLATDQISAKRCDLKFQNVNPTSVHH